VKQSILSILGTTKEILAAGRIYLQLGVRIIPVDPGSKRCSIPGWQALAIRDDVVPKFFGPRHGIGILNGRCSSNLVDVDVDDGFARRLTEYLPKTDFRYGRASAPISHLYYEADDPPRKATTAFLDPVDGATLIEIRSDGGYSLAPPSVHPSGEALTFIEPLGSPAVIKITELRDRVAFVAAAALLAKHWPSAGSRNHAALAVSGALAKAGIPTATVEELLEAAARAAGDEEASARAGTAAPTRSKLDAGEPIVAAARYGELVDDGEKILRKVIAWLGGRSSTGTPAARSAARVTRPSDFLFGAGASEAEEEEARMALGRDGQAVDGAALLMRIYKFIARFVRMSVEQMVVVAVWVAHSYFLGVAEQTAYLSIVSAEKESGKSRLLEVLALLVRAPWMTSYTSTAAIYRRVERDRPTLLLDEADAAFGREQEYSEALRGILNSGYSASGKATVMVPAGKSGWETRDFSTFSAKAIAGIGKLPDTIASRSIEISMVRRKAIEPIERLRRRTADAEAGELRLDIAAWTAANIAKARTLSISVPDFMTDRMQDATEILFVVAELAGGGWREGLEESLRVVLGERAASDESAGVKLLTDIREAFHAGVVGRMTSKELLRSLHGMELSPWGAWNRGKPMTERQVASKLKAFGIASRSIRSTDEEGRRNQVARGYLQEEFEDAWARYLPAREDDTPRKDLTKPKDPDGE
jgi:hypothetical protein